MKKMIKGFAVAAAILVSSAAMADSFLYWMSENTSLFEGNWSTAKVAYRDNGGATIGYLLSSEGEAFAATERLGNDFASMQAAIGSTALQSSYQFALELFSGTSSIATSAWINYDPKFIGGSSFAQQEAKFVFTIPEPTSGLLAMLGFGLLALRRKQKKA